MEDEDASQPPQHLARDRLKRLKQAWLNEVNAPELLPFETDAVRWLHDAVTAQNEQAEAGAYQDLNTKFAFAIYRMEMDRIRYLLSSYLRARLRKIEQHIFHLVHNEDQLRRLSPQERAFVSNYRRILQNHLDQAFLQQIPGAAKPSCNMEFLLTMWRHAHDDFHQPLTLENFRSLNDPQIIEQPNLDRHVFCQFDAPLDVLPLSEDPADRDLVLRDVRRGDVYLLRYRVVRELLLDQTAHLV
ncbi:uncharacterized protein MONBRDRAFT_22745 [Monosiga brevicollis MX1]|uniref:DNA replication complex GINS protein SLD5 n=1 Tax=Monosiga brevicollis TaxID=81824 RepID=A9URY3_MONBE|nr:uncharacterized protein MONBRDRAFT_22745 [Monosiga brevicollis MX1]EDQ91685.1 predicted protein [Monosiga brevicollis MX1]|eukprot:XP_001742971.1 hypothetical protein [Monosiga brevicollis MX1]